MSALTRRLGIGLAFSIGLNLFLLGVLAVLLLHPARRPLYHDRGNHLLFRAGEAFEGDRSRVGRVMREHKKELKTHFRATREARQNVRSALEADPFDAKELERHLDELRAQTEQSQAVLHRALVGLAKEATPEERRRLARWAEGGRPRGARPGKGPEGARRGDAE